uniref:Putative salivary kunitz domain protein n=1 Tax=Ixodes ricinus TaxID=34613 RepID=A0A0K8R4Y2_IXORI
MKPTMQLFFVVSFVIIASIVVGTTGNKEQRRGLNPNCTLLPDDGPCRALIERYYYDSVTGTCHKFLYGGCEGNGNNFDTEPECIKKCKGKKRGKKAKESQN